MSQVIPLPEPLAPVRKSVVVPLTPERAFRLFTEGLSTWWPLASHSISDERAASCGLEPCVGGAIYELRDDVLRRVLHDNAAALLTGGTGVSASSNPA